MNNKILETSIEIALEHANKLGADQTEASCSNGKGFSVQAQNESIETIEHYSSSAFSVTVYANQSIGSATTNDLSQNALITTTEKAFSLANLTARDQFNGLADAHLMAQKPMDLKLYHPWELNVQQAQTMSLECEQAALDTDSKVENTEGANVATYENRTVYANSHGFVGLKESTGHTISCTAIAAENGSMEMDYDYTTAMNAEDLLDHKEIGEKAGLKACAHLGARKIKTQKAKVLFEPRQAKSLIRHLIAAIGGTPQYRKASFLLDTMDQVICPDFINITEEPHLESAFGSTYFDAEGVKTNPRVLVDKGMLTGYLLSSYSARRLNLITTGNAGGHHNLVVEPTVESGLEDIIKSMGTGLMVTSLIGHGVNIVNGDYSRGATGFWVENGEIQYPVSEITIAGNLKNMLRNIVLVGKDLNNESSIICGTILLDDLMIAGY